MVLMEHDAQEDLIALSNWWKSSIMVALAATAVVAVADGGAPKSMGRRHVSKGHGSMSATAMSAAMKSGAETGLIGVKLYDSGVSVLNKFGTPDEVQAVNIGGGSSFGGGGGAGGGAAGGRPGVATSGGGGRKGGGGGGGSAASSAADFFNPNDLTGSETIDQFPGAGGGPPPGAGPPPGMFGPGGGPPGMSSQGGRGGAPGGFPGAAPGGAGGRGAGNAGGGAPPAAGATDRVNYTRWVYNQSGSKYGFVIDKLGRVVQIEAIGLQNAKVSTRRAIGFGANFADIIKRYGTPDGYEIGGDNILMKYLVHSKVAFRLTRLGDKTPQVVTGIVVAAGKS